MKKILFLVLLLSFSCKSDKSENTETSEARKPEKKEFSSVVIENIFEDDSLSIRAVEIIGNNLAFAANKGTFGLYNNQTGEMKTGVISYGDYIPEFRAVASTSNDVFVLSVGNPALLYKTGDSGQMELVYREEGEKVFYDSMTFWNDLEGIAIGDPTENCLSMIITRNGGKSWEKLDCSLLPETTEGEAAFAASNSNIAVVDDNTWVLSGGKKSRVFYSPDKGKTWDVFDTPLIQGSETTGGYSIDFYDEDNGIIIGGDYTKPDDNSANKAITSDGGKTWKLIAKAEEPGYKSSVRFVPNSNGKNIVATGFTGISFSADGGKNWEQLSEESFFTLRFLNDSTAYATGKGRISRLLFK
ncbi:MAG TPA: oxidoreductase [Salegentibacter sp.]|uniref:WD40/YVTN/BNR-like repeat-containing protein n=1 Tax=Salegentibacter sp. TaxID=1903072 RepID=UPI002F935FC1